MRVRSDVTEGPDRKIRVLGGIAVGGTEVSALLERRLLAILAARRGRPAPTDDLVELLWEPNGRPPATARNALMSKVSRLRSVLGPNRLLRTPNGFLLKPGDDGVDVDEFERAVTEAFASDGSLGLVAANAAMELWRGEPFGEFSHEEFAYAETVRLTRLWEQAAERRAELLLTNGHLADALVAAEHLQIRLPASERMCEVRARALAQLGRPADALHCLSEFRASLVDAYGVSPGAGLVALESELLELTAGDDRPSGVRAVAPAETRLPAIFPRPFVGR
ncbi:MAG: BTAD domain-containing putative transcriptional regulator [Ilumatobacteraceae bacterium]